MVNLLYPYRIVDVSISTTPQIDRLFDWQRNPNSGVRETIKRQKTNTKNQFDERVKLTVTEFAEKVGLVIIIII